MSIECYSTMGINRFFLQGNYRAKGSHFSLSYEINIQEKLYLILSKVKWYIFQSHHALEESENDNIFVSQRNNDDGFFGLIFYFIELCKHDKHARREKDKRTKAQLHDLGNKLSDSEREREREYTYVYIYRYVYIEIFREREREEKRKYQHENKNEKKRKRRKNIF